MTFHPSCRLKVGTNLNLIEGMWSLVAVQASDRGSHRKLVEEIGFSATDRVLIIKCDDLGSSRAANLAIERSLRQGIATSTTLMVPTPYAEAAAKSCRDLDVGVHLTLTSEYPTYRWRSVTGAASLHDKDGYLPKTTEEVWARAELDDIERECRAQIDRALEWGVNVTHLDSHMDILQLDRQYFRTYMRLAEHYKLPVRVRSSGITSTFTSISRATLAKHGILTPDRLESAPWGDPGRPTLVKCIECARTGVTEFVLHPVLESDELYSYDTENAACRAADAECLLDRSIRDLIQSKNVALIGFKPLRDAMRRSSVS